MQTKYSTLILWYLSIMKVDMGQVPFAWVPLHHLEGRCLFHMAAISAYDFLLLQISDVTISGDSGLSSQPFRILRNCHGLRSCMRSYACLCTWHRASIGTKSTGVKERESTLILPGMARLIVLAIIVGYPLFVQDNITYRYTLIRRLRLSLASL